MGSSSAVKDDKWCFACGSDNPHGLHLTGFHDEGEYHVVQFTPERQHQGWQDRAHGGIVATLLDEVMTRLLYARGDDAVTAELTVRYHQPLPTGAPVEARARETERRGRLVRVEAEVRTGEGTLIASGQGKFMLIR
jgi:uncharacterized protein (TIGR00369 family)